MTDYIDLKGITNDVNVANGLAGLDGSGKVAASRVADLSGTYQALSAKDAANGYAGLDSNTRVPIAKLASGTPDGTKFVRDDNTLAVPPGSGGTGSWTQLSDTLLVGTAASFDISSISGAYRVLVVYLILRSDEAGVIRGNVLVRFNNDSGGNYDYERLRATATTASAEAATAATSLTPGAYIGNNGTRAANFMHGTLTLLDYADATREKVVAFEAMEADGTATNTFNTYRGGARWRNTAAINRVTVLPGGGNWVAGCRCTIIGIA